MEQEYRLTMSDRVAMKRNDVRKFVREGIPFRIANKLPRSVVKWCVVRACSEAWVKTNKSPDVLCYPEVVTLWEDGPIIR